MARLRVGLRKCVCVCVRFYSFYQNKNLIANERQMSNSKHICLLNKNNNKLVVQILYVVD